MSERDRERDAIGELRRYAAHLESSVHPGRVRARVEGALEAPRPTPRVPRVVVTTAATAVLLAVSNVALAMVADPAVPGDALYGIDRAYEAVGEPFGLAGDLPMERFDEAGVLTARNDADGALALLAEALDGVAGADELLVLLASSDPDLLSERLPGLLGLGRDVLLASRAGADGRLTAAIVAMEHALDAPPVDAPPATAPGQTGETPSATAPGQTGDTPSGTAPGQTGDTPSGTAPGQDESPPSTPGQDDNPSATAPGQSGNDPPPSTPGQDDNPSASAPGQSGGEPSATAPGQDDNPAATAPGQDDNASATNPGRGGGGGRP